MKVIAVLPEVLVGLAAIAGLASSFSRAFSSRAARGVMLALALAALLLELTVGAQLVTLFHGGFSQDRFALYAKAALLAVLVLALITGVPAAGRFGAVALAGTALGGMVVASATDLATIWVGVLTASVISGTVTRAQPGGRARPMFLTVAAANSAAAFGCALVYGVAGFSRLSDIQRVMGLETLSLPLVLALVLLSGAFLALLLAPWFELQTAQWGRTMLPNPAAVLASGAVLLALLKASAALGGVSSAWLPFIALTAAAVLLAGAATALAASTLRALASGVALTQLGWLVAAALAYYRAGIAAALFLLAAFLVAALALALTVPAIETARGGLERVAGAAQLAPYRSLAFALALLSLAGAPPLAGWFGQFTVAVELARSGLFWLLALGFFSSAVAAFASVRALRLMFLEPVPLDLARGRSLARARLSAGDWGPAVAAALILLYGLFSNPIHSLAIQAGTALWVH